MQKDCKKSRVILPHISRRKKKCKKIFSAIKRVVKKLKNVKKSKKKIFSEIKRVVEKSGQKIWSSSSSS